MWSDPGQDTEQRSSVENPCVGDHVLANDPGWKESIWKSLRKFKEAVTGAYSVPRRVSTPIRQAKDFPLTY